MPSFIFILGFTLGLFLFGVGFSYFLFHLCREEPRFLGLSYSWFFQKKGPSGYYLEHFIIITLISAVTTIILFQLAVPDRILLVCLFITHFSLMAIIVYYSFRTGIRMVLRFNGKEKYSKYIIHHRRFYFTEKEMKQYFNEVSPETRFPYLLGIVSTLLAVGIVLAIMVDIANDEDDYQISENISIAKGGMLVIPLDYHWNAKEEYSISVSVKDNITIDVYIISNGPRDEWGGVNREYYNYTEYLAFDPSYSNENTSFIDGEFWKHEAKDRIVFVLDNRDNGNKNDTVPNGTAIVTAKITNLDEKKRVESEENDAFLFLQVTIILSIIVFTKGTWDMKRTSDVGSTQDSRVLVGNKIKEDARTQPMNHLGAKNKKIDEIPKADETPELKRLIDWRREFHRYPEIRWTEFWTTARIIEILEPLGFEIFYGNKLYDRLNGGYEGSVLDLRKNVPGSEIMDLAYQQAAERMGSTSVIGNMRDGRTGVIARIKGRGTGTGGNDGGSGLGNPSSLFGFRFDIDGLPIKEAGTEDSGGGEHTPAVAGFNATNDNMHACGHDGHIAMGLGLAQRISEGIDSLSGEYWFLFQPAEEGGMGGDIFSHLDILSSIDMFATIHLGLIGGRKLSCGLTFMDANAYSVRFTGRSTHSSVAPNEGKNALLAACTAVNNLYAIPRHGNGASRVNVGEFHSDNAMNIISEEASFTYQTRGDDPEIAKYMDAEAKRIIRTAAEMHGVSVETQDQGRYISEPNSLDLMKAVRSVGLELGIPDEAIIHEFHLPGSEDAPYLMRRVNQGGGKAVFMGLGCDTRGGHHNCTFDFDEDLLLWGVEILWELVSGNFH